MNQPTPRVAVCREHGVRPGDVGPDVVDVKCSACGNSCEIRTRESAAGERVEKRVRD